MYITINDVIGEKAIDLSYAIYPEKEIAVVSMFSNNSQILLNKSMEVLLYTGKKIVLNKGIYMDKELDSWTKSAKVCLPLLPPSQNTS